VLEVAADDRPSNAAPIALAIGFGVDEKARDSVKTEHFKERLRACVGAEVCARTARRDFRTGFIERFQNGGLLFGRSRRKSGDARKEFGDALLQLRKAFSIGLLIVHGKSDQGAINEIDDASFACAGSAVTRNDARRERFDFPGFGGSEEFPFLSFGKGGDFVGVLGGSDY